MQKLQLLKEPGFVYDLLTIFTLRFNSGFFVGDGIARNQEEYDKYYDELLNRFGEIPEDLFLFFYVLDGRLNFISTFYFKEFSNRFTTGYNVEYLLSLLSNKEMFVGNLMQFYLQNITDDEKEKCLSSVVDLFSCIKVSSYPDNIKKKLYEFFINPEHYIQVLQYEIMKKSVLLDTYYSENYNLIMEAYNKTTFDSLELRFRGKADVSNVCHDDSCSYVSFCLVNKWCAKLFFLEDGIFFLIGHAFGDVDSDEVTDDIDLEMLGRALCETSRVKILKLLAECGSLTCKDLEKAFEFSGSTAYHHVTLLVRSGAVQTHSERKTIFYSINRDYFDAVKKVLSEYSNKKYEEGKYEDVV